MTAQSRPEATPGICRSICDNLTASKRHCGTALATLSQRLASKILFHLHAQELKPMTKRQGTAEKKAAKKSTKDGQKITRQKTRNRQEVRRETTHRQGHPK
jgi:hypothetical protein